MTVSSTTRKAGPFAGNNLATTFPFNFKIFAKGDIKALLVSPNGLSTQLTLDSDYSVQLNANQDTLPGGWVTYPISGAPLAVNYELVLLGDLPYDQETDLTNSGGFYPQTVEDMTDRSTIQIQQLAEIASRAIVINEAESISPVLPDASGRANTVVGFDALGNLKVYALTPAIGAGDLKDERFVDGIDYTSGVSNYITVSRSYGNKANLGAVVMQGVVQDPNSYSYDTGTDRVTFDAVIPAGIGVIWLKGGTTLSNYVPPDGSVGDDQLQWAGLLARCVDSIAALRQLSKTRHDRAFVVGYYGPHDGGGGAYQLDASDSTTVDNGGTVIVATDGGRWKLQYTGWLSVKQFGGKFDGATADDTAWANAVNSGAGCIYAPPGNTVIANGNLTIPSGVYVIGAGQGATIVTFSSTTADGFLLPSANCGVSRLTITGPTARTTGRMIYCSAAAGPVRLNELSITNYFVGIELNGTGHFLNDIVINNTVSSSAVSYGIKISGGNDQYLNNIIVNNAVGLQPTAGLVVTSCGGSWVTNCDFIHCQNGVLLAPSGTATVTYMFFQNVACDTCSNNSWYFLTAGTATILGCAFSNCWAASAANQGVLAQGTGGIIQGLDFSNTRVFNCGLDGMYFQNNVQGVRINGGIVSGNSETSANTSAGIHIGANLNDFSITGVRIGPDAGFPDKQLNQIQVDAGTGTRISVTGCDLLTANTPVSNAATGSNNTVTACTGCTLKGHVSATTDGSGHVTVTHNIGTVPNTILASVENDSTAIFVQATGTRTTTTFQLKFFGSGGAVAANTGVTFNWSADF